MFDRNQTKKLRRRCVGIVAWLAALVLASCATNTPPASDPVTISIVGTNDVHGELLPKQGRGGLTTLSGYVNALRDTRSDGVVLVLDAGDMWQGTIESNLNEGALVVEAFNAIGYHAAAIGNHEFDFGPAGPKAVPRDETDDARGNLRQRATQASFPLLTANLVDSATGELVNWDNVRPSVMLIEDGVRIGVVGVMTKRALLTTIASNVRGLEVAPLAESIEREARILRDDGAQLVIVVAHAGSQCNEFFDPNDITSCDMDGEIMRVARDLPRGLVDHIIAGHKHQGIAHIVNGTAITSSYAKTHAFSRVDFELDRSTGGILSREIFPPQLACPYRVVPGGDCAWVFADDGSTVVAKYEDRPISPNPVVIEIANRAASFAEARKSQPIGPNLETPFTLKGNPESALGNLLTDALLQSFDTDVAMHNVSGGIRGTLPAGPLQYGSVYEMFPFDNRVVILELSGRELREVIAVQARKSRRRAGFSGMRVEVSCAGNLMDLRMKLDDGTLIDDSARVRVLVNDFLALGGDGILVPIMPDGGFDFDDSLPMTREALISWLAQEKQLRDEQFLTGDNPKWLVASAIPETCVLP